VIPKTIPGRKMKNQDHSILRMVRQRVRWVSKQGHGSTSSPRIYMVGTLRRDT